ncbi:MAG: peptidoglycan DD-metalloendopeptidase family protein [Campylobacterales bacterium]|nr:peptidoglycan DD-metalloendopeptidase family protein [Campylobacterales bacterium]
MIKIFFLAFTLCFIYAENINDKIEQNQQKLQSQIEISKNLQEKIDDLGDKILIQQNKINQIEQKINSLNGVLNQTKDEYEQKINELKNIEKNQSDLIKQRQEIEQKIVFLLSNKLSLSIVLEDKEAKNIDDIINQELFLGLKKLIKKDLDTIKDEYSQTQKNIDLLKLKIVDLKNYISKIDNAKNEFIELQTKEKELITDLKQKKEIYVGSLQKVSEQQRMLRGLLDKLQIVKIEEEQQQEESSKQITKEELSKLDGENIKVRQIGSSYQNVRTLKYSGAKTIAPLDEFSVAKKYGVYIDPVYNLKIFNESVTLKSTSKDAKVKSVLNGKVVLAKETPHLNRVIIIEHENKMHTIYAKLTKIAPTVEVGKVVQKGYTIGRVDEELMFEVTQKNYHIDPLELIYLR